ncbi:MAG: hypothetical protein J0L61_05360 [Planctomycetes bacterium]|nr:hypothetical protein [Planctomycetota bacterium]
MKRRTLAILVSVASAGCLSGCYREVVSAKGLGAASYQNEVGKGGNYSGLPFDDQTERRRTQFVAPGMSSPTPAR